MVHMHKHHPQTRTASPSVFWCIVTVADLYLSLSSLGKLLLALGEGDVLDILDGVPPPLLLRELLPPPNMALPGSTVGERTWFLGTACQLLQPWLNSPCRD